MATAFGDGRLRQLERSAIPAWVVHSQTLATLTDIGFPALADGRGPTWLTTVDLDRRAWSLSMLRATPSRRTCWGTGWARRSSWAVTPAVLLASAAGGRLLGSSLRQFMTLVSLYVTLRRTAFSTRYEQEDARRSLAARARHIDQPAGSSRSWTAAFGGDLDVPESL
ncbi:SUKH-4 family immunity protein [Streptomyces nigra]|uniref:SUKH-4 family immunity protein n=1 Tax=Streptomyces nigra TaxID=1827580 RepID=UPI0036C52C62